LHLGQWSKPAEWGGLVALQGIGSIEEKARFGRFPLLPYLGRYRTLLSVFSAAQPSGFEPLPTISRCPFTARAAIALRFPHRPILDSAIVTPAIFISPFRHSVSPKEEGPSKGPERICLIVID